VKRLLRLFARRKPPIDAAPGDRSELLIAALQRQRDELAGQLAACRKDLSRADSSGRIAALEAENQRLRQRLHDLEAYLKHTRGEGARYYL
jgi:septal ring factor EnvC (AmiA/AmiB activator)